jgi:hypothetical protein
MLNLLRGFAVVDRHDKLPAVINYVYSEHTTIQPNGRIGMQLWLIPLAPR